jgi:hypothetical protein
MSERGWSRAFFDPMPDGRELRTLRDAADYITKLPKREHDSLAWRVATEALLLVAEHGGGCALVRCGANASSSRTQEERHAVRTENSIRGRRSKRTA